MFKRFSFYVVFLLCLVLFFNLTKINRINFYVESQFPNFIFVQTGSNIFVQNIQISDRFKKTAVFYKADFDKIKISLKDTPCKFKLKNIIIVSTIFPFNISTQNLEKYFTLNNVEIIKEQEYNVIKFKSLYSNLESKPVLHIQIFILRIFVILLVSYLITALIIFLLNYISIILPILLVLSLVLPALLTPLNVCTLNGVQEKSPFPEFSFESFRKREFQKHFEKYFNQRLTFNNIHLKTLNTVLYYLLEKSFGNNEKIVVGKNKVLYDFDTINMQQMQNVDKVYIDEQVKKIKKVQEYYEKQGKTFVVLITCTKADLQQEYIPDRFNTKPQYIQKTYEASLESFKLHKVNLIDTSDYVKKNNGKHVLFPKGGIHWSDYPKYLGTKYFLKMLEFYKNQPFENLIINQIIRNNVPENEDVDLAELLNLLTPPINYVVEHIYLNPFKTHSNLKLKFIGGSFSWGIEQMLNNAQVFNYIDVYFYLKMYKSMSRNFIKSGLDFNVVKDPKALMEDISDGDIIVLEINKCILDFKNFQYMQEFCNLVDSYH